MDILIIVFVLVCLIIACSGRTVYGGGDDDRSPSQVQKQIDIDTDVLKIIEEATILAKSIDPTPDAPESARKVAEFTAEAKVFYANGNPIDWVYVSGAFDYWFDQLSDSAKAEWHQKSSNTFAVNWTFDVRQHNPVNDFIGHVSDVVYSGYPEYLKDRIAKDKARLTVLMAAPAPMPAPAPAPAPVPAVVPIINTHKKCVIM